MVKALSVRGRDLVDSDGHVVRLPGVDAFALFKRFLMTNGWDALVAPILTEWRAIASEAGYSGAIILRVFRFAGPPNAFALEPWSYYDMATNSMPKVAEFTRKCGELGFYIDWTAGDAHICFPTRDGRMGETDGRTGIRQHNNLFCAALVGLPYIWNTCNEEFKNGMDTSQVKPPPWCSPVAYSGNYDDNRDKSNDLSCVNLHTDRSEEAGAPKWVGKAHESAPYMWRAGKPVFYDEPMGADEVDKPGARSCEPRYFGILGTVIAMVSAVYFHATDAIACNSLRPRTRLCAVEFFKGVVGGLKVGA